MQINDLTVKDESLPAPAFIEVGGATGFESIDNECISIPFLRLAQVNTPQAQPGDSKLAGLEAGMYFNPSTGRIYGKEASFVILGFHRTWNVWQGEPPNARFVKSMLPEEFLADSAPKTHRDDKGKTVDDAGNRYVDNRNFFLLSADHPEDGILLYPMSSTGIPASKKWLAKATAIRVKDADGNLAQAPMWSRVWTLRTGFVQSPKGNFFQVSDVADRGWIPESLVAVVKSAFEEAQAYSKSRLAVKPAEAEDEPFAGQF
jgi:hypothetical protein